MQMTLILPLILTCTPTCALSAGTAGECSADPTGKAACINPDQASLLQSRMQVENGADDLHGGSGDEKPAEADTSSKSGMTFAVTSKDTGGVEMVALSRSEKNTNQHLATWKQAFQEDPKLLAGCSSIFVDVGSNRGTHVRKLFEPQKYPKSTYLRVFDEGFGAAEKRNRSFAETGICAFGFEANPRWTSTLQQLEKAYAAQGWRVKWFAPEAVGNTTGDMTFWNNDVGEDSDWGFSIVKTHNYSTRTSVPVIDLADFIEHLNKSAPSGYRLMKMDVEAAEFEVLPPFLSKQLLCEDVLDKLTIEWHDWLLKSEAAKQHAAQLENRVKSTSKCNQGPSTKVVALDDESYLDDGMPLPGQ